MFRNHAGTRIVAVVVLGGLAVFYLSHPVFSRTVYSVVYIVAGGGLLILAVVRAAQTSQDNLRRWIEAAALAVAGVGVMLSQQPLAAILVVGSVLVLLACQISATRLPHANR